MHNLVFAVGRCYHCDLCSSCRPTETYSFRTDFTDLNLYCIKGALALFVLVFLLATCASFRVHVKLSLSYRIVSYQWTTVFFDLATC